MVICMCLQEQVMYKYTGRCSINYTANSQAMKYILVIAVILAVFISEQPVSAICYPPDATYYVPVQETYAERSVIEIGSPVSRRHVCYNGAWWPMRGGL